MADCRFLRRFTVAAALLLTTTLMAKGQTAGSHPFTLAQVMSSPFPNSLTTAEHADRIAWVFDAKGVRNVWVADGPTFQAHAVTHYQQDDGQDLGSLALTPDGRTVVYVRGGELNADGDAPDPTSSTTQPLQQVWAVDVAGGQPRLLGPMGCGAGGCRSRVRISPDGRWAAWSGQHQIWVAPVSGAQAARTVGFVRGDNYDPRWSPDSRTLAFVSSRDDHSFIALYRLGGGHIQYMQPSVDRDRMPRWSPDGKTLLYVRIPGLERYQTMIPLHPEPFSLWVGDPKTGAAHAIWRSTDDMRGSLPEHLEGPALHLTSDGHVTFASTEDGRYHLYSLPVNATPGTTQPLLLTPGESDVAGAKLEPNGHTLLFSSNQGDIDRLHIWKVEAAGGAPVQLMKGATIEWSPEQTSGGEIVCLGSSATSPAMPYVVAGGARRMIAARALPPDFPSAQQLVTPKPVIFRSGTFEIHGQLFVPHGRTQAGPALIFVHGGPMRQMLLGFHPMQYYHNAYAENEYLTSLGFVILSVNYRSGTGYGQAFRHPANAGWRGASEYQDVLAGVRYLDALPTVDRKKVGIWGGSWGGFLTALALARNSDLFAAGSDMHGVHDWRTEHDVFQDAPDLVEAQKLAFASSPDAAVAGWRSPVLLIQGDDDRNVGFRQMVNLVQLLRAHQVPFEQIVFPDEIHEFLRWATWMHAYGATADFLQRVLMDGQKIGVH